MEDKKYLPVALIATIIAIIYACLSAQGVSGQAPDESAYLAESEIEETEDVGEPEDTKSIIVMDDFSIEGSWKNIGDDGFGQAQPGAIVVFDGAHCNFFSPYDTYAFYIEDGEYRLDCTSVLFSDTLSFAVEIMDEDNINVDFDSTVTKLKRVN